MGCADQKEPANEQRLHQACGVCGVVGFDATAVSQGMVRYKKLH